MTRIGDWEIRATGLLRKHGRLHLQPHLLYPPHGFVGRVRLAVIGGGRRDESVRAWTSGARDPLLFDAPLEGGSADAAGHAEGWVHADLLLQLEPATGAPEMLSGALAGRGPSPNASIDVMPLLAGSASARPDRAVERGLASALRALRRDPSLRLAVSGAWMSAMDAAGHAAKRAVLVGRGQLELLAAPAELASADVAVPAQFPPRTAWIEAVPRGSLAALVRDLPASVRYVLFPAAAAADTGAVPTRFVLTAPDEPAARVITAATLGEPHGRPDTFNVANVQLALGLDALLVQAAALAAPAPDGRRTLVPASWYVPLVEPGELVALRSFARRWNRHYASPRLRFATPGDYFTTLDELERRGVLTLPGINPA